MDVGCQGAYFVDNWFFGYQVYCTHPTEYWLNFGGWLLLLILSLISIILGIIEYKKINKK